MMPAYRSHRHLTALSTVLQMALQGIHSQRTSQTGQFVSRGHLAGEAPKEGRAEARVLKEQAEAKAKAKADAADTMGTCRRNECEGRSRKKNPLHCSTSSCF